MALSPGTQLGRYEIVDLIGEGGMGEVYRARDLRLRRDVALKVLHPGPGGDAARLLREARVVSTLTDPHIVTVHDVDESDGIAFVAMELVDGAPLTRRVVPGGLPIDELLRLGIDIAAGLARAHAAGVVHRDLKPANVMVTSTGTAKILDFGLATEVAGRGGDTSTFAALSRPGMIAGTAAYMSPEQAEGRTVDARSDVFAFGVLLFELATGRRAFARDSAVATLAAILRDPAPALADLRPDLPPTLVNLVERCLRKAPDRRFHAMADVRIALEDLRDDQTRGPTPGHVVAQPAPQHRWWSGIIAAAALVAAGATAAGAVAWWRAAPSPSLAGIDLRQLTFDAGYSGTPALSADGTLLAFASDRDGAGNLDIWVQPVAGGAAIQVTRDTFDERMPAFSPDGGRIVFRSERDGGGIYSVPALGGDARLIVAGGLSPRLSPDGRQLAYWTGTGINFNRTPGSYHTYVVDAAGGTPREIDGFTNIRFPVWSPDGRRLIVSATQAETPNADTYDWWVVPLDGGPPVPTGAHALLGVATFDEGTQGSPSAWTGDRVLTSRSGDLWAVVLTGPGHKATAIERLTFGPGSEVEPAATADGIVAFADSVSSNNIWSLPIDADRAHVLGDLRRVTKGSGRFWRASLSADERRAAFNGPGRPFSILVQDLETGRIRDLGVVPGGAFGPVISPDGQRVAYAAEDGELRTVAVSGGAPAILCRGCQDAGDWTRDNQRVTVVTRSGGTTALGLADVATGETTALARAGEGMSLNRPTLSPDNRWLAFREMGSRQQVYVASFTGSMPLPREAWVSVSASEPDIRPVGWSPNGRMLYLFSARDGFRCLYVQAVDPATGRPVGDTTLVKHMHNVRALGGGGGSVVSSGPGNAVGRQQILVDFPELEVNVWRMRLGVLAPPGAGDTAPR